MGRPWDRSVAAFLWWTTVQEVGQRGGVGAQGRGLVRTVANKKVRKDVRVSLTRDIPKLGQKSSVVTVRAGHWRNFLKPQGLATVVTAEMDAALAAEAEAEAKVVAKTEAKEKVMAKVKSGGLQILSLEEEK